MASAKVKTQDEDEVIIEEEIGVFEQTIKQVSAPTTEKRKRDDELPTGSPSKYASNSDRDRSGTTTAELDALPVPFWKKLNYRQPFFETNEIGFFSLINRADEKECFDDKRYLRVYKYPVQTLNVNFDLKIGELDFTSDEQSKNINAMLWWTLKNKDTVLKNNKFTFDFLSWRGVLRLIMFSIFEKHSDWLLAVIKFKNAYFLCEYVTDSQIKEEQNMTAQHRSFCYYGHKFEEYVTKNNTSIETLNPSKQFSGVFQSTIGSHRLLYGAEMDCVIERSSSTTEHIELKVCAGKTLDDLPFRYNRKFAKWWIQCFLVGIKTMIIGLRDDNGIVNTLTPLNISQMEQAAETWTRQSFFNFFLSFADFLKKHVTNEYSLDQKDVVLFHFEPSSQRITMKKSSDSKYHFIPDWFFNGFQ
ncbi:unnamed protein product [Adineta steineri]|uniref:Decapping nuclease n=1 Tax=Adineta steineri TaxID=433720 RepID=A0A818XBM1_9BILA|nr:unnamed protein product [Adineta steineri]